jgi:energy-coupling factor transporter ATP-binding protein EcfA2
MKREDFNKNIKEKMLFEGPSGSGKTNLSLKIAKIYTMNNKKVLYIDPEYGTDRDLEKIFGNLENKELDNIELIHATNIDTYIKYMYGWIEDRSIGTQINKVQCGLNYDLKVCDGLGTEIELYKANLSQKFQKQGYYEIGGKRFDIINKDTFVLPYQFYGKLYDQIKEALVIMLDHKYDIIATLHPLKQTESQQELKQALYQKFDSVIRLNKELLPNGFPQWNCTIVKNRGRESPDKSNSLESVEPLIKWFIKKFNMPVEETLERLK